MINPKEITVKKEKETKVTGQFVIEPLPSGYGHTLGNALRRVLLSSLPGAAIGEISIVDVSHPFTTIKGIKEDVIELILNLKKVCFIMHADEPLEGRIEAEGKKRGEKVVTAGDIKLPSGVKVANPELKIATLTDKSAKLSIKLLVERGVGYKTSEEREGSRVGVIPMDSVFSPVTKVAYRVEETRRGRETNLDRLIVEITTDGTIKPSEALEKAAIILAGYLQPLTGKKPAKAVEIAPAEKKEKVEGPPSEVRRLALSELNLSLQTVTVLTGVGIKSVGGLLQKSEEDLFAIRGFGERRLAEVKQELKGLGVALRAVKPSSAKGGSASEGKEE